MPIRIGSNQYHLNSLDHIQNALGRHNAISVQLATNQRIQTPSDDPMGAVSLLTLNAQHDTLEQYQTNMNTVNFNLGQQETYLSGIVDVLYASQSIATRAADDSNGINELRALGQELSVLAEGALDLLNTQDADGDYLFSGSEVDTQPFQLDTTTGLYSYQGDAHTREVAISHSSRVTTNITGATLDPNADFLNALNDYTAVLENPTGSVTTESHAFLTELEQFLGRVNSGITEIGSTLASVDLLAIANDDVGMFIEGLRDDIQVVDTAEGYVQLNQALSSYEASLRVYSSVTELTLFQFV